MRKGKVLVMSLDVNTEYETISLPAFADDELEILYQQNFETYDEASGNKTLIADGWYSNASTVSVKTDNTSGINRYMAITGGNASRSGYKEITPISGNFVFEADLKTIKTSRVSELQLVESYNGSIYENHGVDSTKSGGYVFTMDRPANENLYVINNGVSDSVLSLKDYNQPAITTKEITGDEWIHVKVVGDFTTGTVITYVTSLDGKTEYYHGMTDMSKGIKSFKCIHILGPTANIDTAIANIKIYKARQSDLAPIYHKVTMICQAYTFYQYVLDGESIINIPDISSYGSCFCGWNLNGTLYTSKELASVPITSDCEIIGQVSDNYIEEIASVEFNAFPVGNELVMGADENTPASNAISLTIKGEQGTSLVTNQDERVEDFNVEWTFDGFRIFEGRPTGESGNNYCEGCGLVESTAAHNTAVNFKIKRTDVNYYGRVTAKVTYNGKIIEVSKPLILLGDKSGTDLLPKAGYAADYNKYEDSLIGYRTEQNDLILGGWQSYGSDTTYMHLRSDAAGKYFAVSRAASGNSSAAYNEIGNIMAQTVFEQDIRFGIDGSISYVGGNTMTDPSSTAFTFAKSGANMTLNGTNIYTSASANTWYHVIIHADPTSKKCFARVYELADDYTNAAPLAVSPTLDFGTYTSGSAYRVSPNKSSTGSIDINNVRIYAAEINESTINVTAPQIVNIPESGTTNMTLSISAKTMDGMDSIGIAEWRIDDEFAEGVTITGSGNTAVIEITSEASSGDLPICVTIGGKSKIVNIRLLASKDNIAFTAALQGIQLGTEGTYKFTAVVRNGQAEIVTGRDVLYSIVDDRGSPASPEGISITDDGTLTVDANVQPQTIYIKAQSVDDSDNKISRTFKTILYNLKFSFGTGAVQSGYTGVSVSTAYSDSLGFGIDSGKESADGMTDGIFRLKLEKGKVYEVTAVYQGSITCERIDAALNGFVHTKDTMGSDTYRVAIFGDDIMDIAISGTLKSISVTPVTKKAASKPDWWTIGDSTIQQKGSWGYTIASSETTCLSEYPELAAVINGFHNSGRAGRKHMSYYSEGLLNDVLTGMNPGDVVSISGMGTNDLSSTLEQFKAYDEAYMNAIIDMGGYVILGSYTPSGNFGETAGKVYDADNMAFKGLRTNSYDRAIRELYRDNADNPKVLGFLDIGQMADDKMTSDVQNVYNSTNGSEKAKRDAADARASEMMAWWRDYSHYGADFSNYILPDITKAAAELIDKINQ
ncbi:MAG: hypothetical protein J1G06_08965 [Oscillospiraceae bacterium]|nr:hypothetical protein [Oscillospiraceae bacterium]